MFELFFVLGCFSMLMFTGISLLLMFFALFFAVIVMLFSGLLVFAGKLLPLFALILVGIWIYRSTKQTQEHHR